MPKHFDTAIIGAGQAGPALAMYLADGGASVAMIEGNLLGGSCVNYGCTPTKTLRKSARVAYLARRAADFGVSVGDVTVDFAAAMARMRDRVQTSRGGLESGLEGSENIEILRGWGAFTGHDNGRFTLQVGDQTVTADKIYINTGTRASIPPIKGVETVPYLDNVSLLELTECPAHLIVVGGSYIGLEMGQIFRRLGAQVTILNSSARLASREDEDVSAIIQEFIENEDIRVMNNIVITRAEKSDSGVAVILDNNERIEGTHLLFATGRVPNSDRLNLDNVGVNTDDNGYIETDAQLQTNVNGIWALGDVNKRGAFTHTSYHDHQIVLANSAKNVGSLHQWRSTDERPTTYAMFTDPPLGRVGMNLADARQAAKKGRHILTAERKMSDVARAKEEGETAGVIRLIVDGETEQILGASIIGISADEVTAVITNFMATKSSYRILQQALPIHPTVAELLPTVLAGLKRLSVV
jgi:pyruvate/2-oxoglutarate dehydrogenase complex dihydrolipoamide dehydrogenase (E3) component